MMTESGEGCDLAAGSSAESTSLSPAKDGSDDNYEDYDEGGVVAGVLIYIRVSSA